MGDTQAVEPLIAVLRDEKKGVRWHVARALGKLGDVRAAEPLIAALQNDARVLLKGRVCNEAAKALEQIGTPEALDAVRQWREEQKRRR
ncbi:MAG: HEAT repeat domain-containing protein [Anaerolineae bacterium]|nr:HEAT repeat domain-containing protein [Anaerolineae bacterium]